MTRIGIRFPIVSALLLAVLTAERQALSCDAWYEAELYRVSVLNQLHTHHLERTITILSALVLRKPEDADYQMTLNHACGSPLASVHCATETTKIVD
ncbi:MAG: hypothetical protein JWN14_4713 [Chthonomonadales bacterium]|nr:hypothetical protein [Chthonomonadales bacterium]